MKTDPPDPNADPDGIERRPEMPDPSRLRDVHDRTGRVLKTAGLPFEEEEFEPGDDEDSSSSSSESSDSSDSSDEPGATPSPDAAPSPDAT